MRRFFAEMNPTVRGFLIILLITAVIVSLSLYQTLAALYLLARIAFFIAIALFVYMVWRERRGEIATWPARAQVVFYGGAALIAADLGVLFWRGFHGADVLAFFAVLILCGFSMWRVWKEQRSYGL